MPPGAISDFSRLGGRTISGADDFWKSFDAPRSNYALLRYSFFFGFFAYAGYTFSYAVTGRVWNYWPFVQTTLTVQDSMMRALMQWIFFGIFPFLASLLLQLITRRQNDENDWNLNVLIVTYSLTPVPLAALFVGIPFVHRITALLAVSTFLYLTYFGYRTYAGRTILSAAAHTFCVALLFVLIRQVFVYAIGF